MSFKDRIGVVAKRLEALRQHGGEAEEATKTAVIMPFLNALGYDIFNPAEVQPEFTADVGTKRGEKVDYGVFIGGRLQIIIEAKPIICSLKDAQYSQLYRYFGVTDAHIAMLTNGEEYWFFTDIDAPNKMDERPFFKFSLITYDDSDLRELEKFCKEAFSIYQVRSTAASLKYSRLAAAYLNEQILNPDDEFVRFIGRNFYDGNVTAKVVEILRPNIKRAFEDILRQRVRTRLEVALDQDEKGRVDQIEEETANDLETSDEELEGFYIIRAIAAEIVDPERVTIRDQKSYCGVLFDNNNRKPIARLWFNGRSKSISLFNENKIEEKASLNSVTEIYNHKQKIRDLVEHYLSN